MMFKIAFRSISRNARRTFFATGFLPDDQRRTQRWNGYGVGENLESTALRTNDASQGVIGFGFARYMGLCERLHLSHCPQPPKDAPTRDSEALSGLPQQDFSGLTSALAPQNDAPRIDLLAATAGGAPNIVSMRIDRVEKQAAQEMDDGYVVMNLGPVYGRNEAKVTGIVLQLHRSADMRAARKRLSALFAANHLNLEVRDYLELNSYLGQTLSLSQFMFAFIAVLIGVVVLFASQTSRSTSRPR